MDQTTTPPPTNKRTRKAHTPRQIVIRDDEDLPPPPPQKKQKRNPTAPPLPESDWVKPPAKIDTAKFIQGYLTFDSDQQRDVNWWSTKNRYPTTVGELVDLEKKYGIEHSQNTQWSKARGNSASAELPRDVLETPLAKSLIELSDCPRTRNTTAVDRLADRILRLAKKQVEHRREITEERLRIEKVAQNNALLTQQRETQEDNSGGESTDDDEELIPSTTTQPVPDETDSLSDQYEYLQGIVLSKLRGDFLPDNPPADLYNGDSDQDDGEGGSLTCADDTDLESDQINSRTPIDSTRRVFAKRWIDIADLDFRLQIRAPAWTTPELLDEFVQDPVMEGLSPEWIGIPGKYSLTVDMKDAPHDAAYSYAYQHRDKNIEQHTRQWFVTLNWNMTRAEILEKLGRTPEQLEADALALLDSYDPSVVRNVSAVGEFDVPLGAIRQWKVLYHGSEIAPRTRYFHMHLLLSCTYIRFGPMTIRLDYPRLLNNLRAICDVAYFHAIAVKRAFHEDYEANTKELKRLKGYIEKSMEYCTERNAEQFSKDPTNRMDGIDKSVKPSKR